MGEYVPLKDVVGRNRLAAIEVRKDLADRFAALQPTSSERLRLLAYEFYKAFLTEAGNEAIANGIIRVAGGLSSLPDRFLESPMLHPAIGRGGVMYPDELLPAVDFVEGWFGEQVGADWKLASATIKSSDLRVHIPAWFVLSILELGRAYLQFEPDSFTEMRRAREFLLHRGRLAAEFFEGWTSVLPEWERVDVQSGPWFRVDSQARQDFVLAIVGGVMERALEQIVSNAEAADRLAKQMESKGDPGHSSAVARDAAREVLGKRTGRGGSRTRGVQDLLTALGFLS